MLLHPAAAGAGWAGQKPAGCPSDAARRTESSKEVSPSNALATQASDGSRRRAEKWTFGWFFSLSFCFPLCLFCFPLTFHRHIIHPSLNVYPFICLSTFPWFCVIYLSHTEHLRFHLLSWVGTAKAREMHVENLSEFMLVWHFGKLLPTEYFEHTQQYHKHAHISQHIALFWTSVSGNGENSLVSSSVGLRSSCRDF